LSGHLTAVRQETIDIAFDYSDRCCGGHCPPYEKNSRLLLVTTPVKKNIGFLGHEVHLYTCLLLQNLFLCTSIPLLGGSTHP